MKNKIQFVKKYIFIMLVNIFYQTKIKFSVIYTKGVSINKKVNLL